MTYRPRDIYVSCTKGDVQRWLQGHPDCKFSAFRRPVVGERYLAGVSENPGDIISLGLPCEFGCYGPDWEQPTPRFIITQRRGASPR